MCSDHKRLYQFTLGAMFILLVHVYQCMGTDQHLDRNAVKSIVDTCIAAFNTYYLYPEAANRMGSYLERRFSDKSYDTMTSLADLTDRIKKDLREVSNDRHIWVDIMENLPVTAAGISESEIIDQKKLNNFGFAKFEILPDNIGYLKIDTFTDLKYAREAAIHAMGMVANSDAVIIDLRENHGGHENMVRFIASYFFEKKTRLNSLYFRAADSLVEGWTDPAVPGKSLSRTALYILTSRKTASAAESFVCAMKNYKRALVVGERTRGAAHWTETFKFPDLGIFLEIPVARPINPVTGKGWEGEGILPDIEVAAKGAYNHARGLK